MTTQTVTTAASVADRRGSRKARTVVTWVVQVGLATQFAMAGIVKLTGDPSMVAMFDLIGAGQWLRIVVGVLEIAGAIGLLVPRLAGPAAVGLVALMLGATVTNVAVLGAGPVLPVVFAALALLVVVLRRDRLAALVRTVRGR